MYIPCFNAEKSLGKCLDGVFKQTYPFDEVLIINDGSEDKTVEVASKFPVRVISHKTNEGLGASRNKAIKNARNGFIAALDSDCVAEDDWLEKLMENFTQNDIAGGGGKVIETCNSISDQFRNAHMKQEWGAKRIINPEFLFGSNTVFRKSVLEDFMYNRKYRTNYEDVDLSQRLMKRGFKLIYEPRAIVRHLRRDPITSVMKSSWAWTFHGFEEPDSVFDLMKRVKFNGYKMFKYMLRDLQEKGFELAVMDLMILPTHMYLDVMYYLKRK